MHSQKSEKWSNDQIETLIDAYKEELCLYATNLATYHNKHLRADAMERVCKAVTSLRPFINTKECSTKFHNLRNQFNIENAKVKTSFKSGTGTDDIYKPSLWYYEKLLFLDPYVTPRKSRNSMENEEKKQIYHVRILI
uniref:MADF domain-containing protein n=1 Tax=Sipha flava TaxID=143950 RepID=A0A2S2R1S6_9HEMI